MYFPGCVPAGLSDLINSISGGTVKFGWRTSSYRSEADPIVIGGCGRSGTTLLRVMLNAHKDISIGPETHILCGSQKLSEIAVETRLTNDQVVSAYRRSACLAHFAEDVCGNLLNENKKRRWGEKSPSNVNAIAYIFRFFPRARFIHMIRDGRDVVCSLRTHPKYRWKDGERVPTGICRPWEVCIRRWLEDTTSGLKWENDSRYLEVRYMRLVEDPIEELRRILLWLDEEWDDSLEHFYHTQSDVDATNPGVMSPIYTSAIGRWKMDMTHDVRVMFAKRAGPLLKRLGFAEDDEWVNDPQIANDVELHDSRIDGIVSNNHKS